MTADTSRKTPAQTPCSEPDRTVIDPAATATPPSASTDVAVVWEGLYAPPPPPVPEGTYVCQMVGWSEAISTKGGKGWFRILDARIAAGLHTDGTLKLRAFSRMFTHAKAQRLLSLEKVARAIAGRDAVIESAAAAEQVIERAIQDGGPTFQAVVKWRIFDTVQYDNLCAWSRGNKRARATRWGREHLKYVDEDGLLYAKGVDDQRVYPTAEITSVRPLRKRGKSKRSDALNREPLAGATDNRLLYSAGCRTTITGASAGRSGTQAIASRRQNGGRQ